MYNSRFRIYSLQKDYPSRYKTRKFSFRSKRLRTDNRFWYSEIFQIKQCQRNEWYTWIYGSRSNESEKSFIYG